MSASRPLGRSIRPVAMAEALYASQGMVGPAGFVGPEGELTDVAYRFLHSLFLSISQLQQDVATIQQRLANAGIP